ncbi:MAG: hypothetical protein AAB152_11235 [Candidatus Coatesbacteria bacterium]
MRKTVAILLVAVCAVAAGGQVAKAADRAGVGLEWSIGPAMSLSGFDMKMGQQFTLSWKVSESFSVGVWNGNGLFRGEKTYTDNTAVPLKHTLVTQGTTSSNGITLLTTFPGISLLDLGINVGVETFTGGAATENVHTDGSAGVPGHFGAPVALTTTAAVLGIAAKIHLIKAETKTVMTDIGILAGLNFVEFADTAVFGTQQAVGTVPLKNIDSVGSYNNLTVMINAALWF